MPFVTMPNTGLAPRPQYRVPHSLRGPAIAASVLLSLDVAVCVAAMYALTRRIAVVRDVLAGRDVTVAAAQAVDDAFGAVVLVTLLLFAATAVPFIVWSYRLVGNVRSLGREPHPGPSWAIAGWFIPIANFGLPARTLMATDRHSDSAGRAHRWLIVTWAIVLGVGGIIAREASQLLTTSVGLATTNQASLIRGDEGERLGFGLLALAAVLAIVIVVDLTRRQERALVLAAQAHAQGQAATPR